MVKKLFAKLTSLVLVVMLALTMIPSGIAFAGTADYEFVVTADKTSAVKDDYIIVTVTMNGSYKELKAIQIGIVYDPTAVSIDVTNTGTNKKPRYDNGVDENWYDECVLDEDNHLGYAFEFNLGNKAYPDDTSKNITTIMYYSGKGYTIDSDCGLYNETTAVIAKYKFKALKNIDSVADILKEIGLEHPGAPGTTAALALLNDQVKKGGVMASSYVGGLSGAFIPVSEDQGMIDAVRAGALTLEKLEAMTCVCSVGLDMIAIPGDTKSTTISGIIADEMAIGMINQKTTAVRLIPVIGKGVGEVVEFGGLLGYAPVMPVNNFACDAFVNRGGRIPAPIHSFKN